MQRELRTGSEPVRDFTSRRPPRARCRRSGRDRPRTTLPTRARRVESPGPGSPRCGEAAAVGTNDSRKRLALLMVRPLGPNSLAATQVLHDSSDLRRLDRGRSPTVGRVVHSARVDKRYPADRCPQPHDRELHDSSDPRRYRLSHGSESRKSRAAGAGAWPAGRGGETSRGNGRATCLTIGLLPPGTPRTGGPGAVDPTHPPARVFRPSPRLTAESGVTVPIHRRRTCRAGHLTPGCRESEASCGSRTAARTRIRVQAATPSG
ncbi:hypothetical protein ETAA1_39150 [Urbifossiella limnaea]|uniref:Uncharacterized protein n=1 Tax=Urbifossiella limnaea TaxID=2528023 RepID=A0A517XWQ7_9BACT|nr:hypothetical protein ETAA1_39150 [Urbifossiella limnaea]